MNFLSRKLLAAWAAMLTIAGLLVGLAVIDTALLETNKELLILAIGAIAGLGGFAINKQAQVDTERAKNGNSFVTPFDPPTRPGAPTNG